MRPGSILKSAGGSRLSSAKPGPPGVSLGLGRLQNNGFCLAPHVFGARSNYTKSNRLPGCSCTKHVPFRYRFDEKPALIARLTASRFLPARILKLAAAGR